MDFREILPSRDYTRKISELLRSSRCNGIASRSLPETWRRTFFSSMVILAGRAALSELGEESPQNHSLGWLPKSLATAVGLTQRSILRSDIRFRDKMNEAILSIFLTLKD